MFVSHRNSIDKKELTGSAMSNVAKQVLVGPEQGWKDHVMRMFTLAEAGFTPRHHHDWQHIIYVVEGRGTLFLDGTDHLLTAGSVAYVPNGAEHQLMNTGSEIFVFICIVPEYGDK
jgi:quercetin dioxygenase-like cupin family protein